MTVEPEGPNEVVTTITPRSAKALSVEWVDDGEILDLTAGHNGGSWDFLERKPDDVDFIEQVTRSVIAGRVVEIFAYGRSRVQVKLADGTLVEETSATSAVVCPFHVGRDGDVEWSTRRTVSNTGLTISGYLETDVVPS